MSEANNKEKGGALPLPTGCKTDELAANLSNNFYVEKVEKLRSNLQHKLCRDGDPSPQDGPSEVSKVPFAFSCIGVAEVRKALHNLEPKNTTGVDGIPITIYKAAWAALALPLVHVANLIITTGVWPSEWKKSIIKPVLKASKPRLDIGSYRPIAMLCSVSKLVERVLYDQLVLYVEAHGLLPSEQHGFRTGRSVDTALAAMSANIAKEMDSGKKVGISAFDFSAAFDTVEADTLLNKLSWAGCAAKTLLNNYLKGGQQQVDWNGSLSSWLEIPCGVRQGSVLGPLLFILLTADLPHRMTSNNTTPSSLALSLYADDTSCAASSKSWEATNATLDQAAADLEEYSVRNGLHLNIAKTQTLRLAHPDTPTSTTLNILGVSMNKQMSFAPHHSAMLADIRRRIGVIRHLQTNLSRGKLLNEVALALVVGRLQGCAWVTRQARLQLQGSPPTGDDTAIQIAMNDLARVLLGVRLADRWRVSDLANRANLPTVNEIVIKQSAIAAWKAVNNPSDPLREVLPTYDTRTRGASSDLRRPISPRCIAAVNMTAVWNSSQELRSAVSLAEAKRVAVQIASSARFC